MRKFGYRVGLIHELRQLRRTEKFFNRARNGSYVYKSRGRNVLGVLRGHTLFYNPFKTGNTYSELVLQKFAYRTHAPVAEVVDVVHRAYAVV